MATTSKGYPYPTASNANNVPADIQALAATVDTTPGIATFTTAERDALAGGARWVGRTIYNSTKGLEEVWDGAAWKGVGSAVPVGVVTMWFGSSVAVPAGWLVCDGSAFNAATFPDLNTLLGGNVLPNMTDRLPMGVSGTKTKGSTGGAETATLQPANMPPHTHTVGPRNSSSGATGSSAANFSASASTTTSLADLPTGNGPGNSTPLSILPPYLALYFIIRATL